MKKAVFLLEMLCAICLIFSVVSCDSNDEELFEPSLELKGENEFPAEGGECVINVASNAEWDIEIEKGVDWLIVSEKTKEKVVITVKDNPLADQRSSQITIKLKTYSKSDSLTIKQEGSIDEIVARGYVLQSSMQGDASLVGKNYGEIHSYMRKYGWDYSEHPNSSTNDHKDGIHCQNIFDEVLQQYVFKFMAHIDPILDGDRGKIADRQRNEMRTQASSKWSKMNGNFDDKQVLRWKFKIPKGFRPSTSFTHIHQLKTEEGDNSTRPLITLTLRGSNNGTKRRLQVIHNGKSGVNKDDKIVDNIPIEDFEDEWVQVEEEIHYNHNGLFRIKIIRIKDNKVLMDYANDNIDMWRTGAKNILNKYGIYRSFGKKLTDPSERPSNGIKDESFYIADLYIYEKESESN